MNFLILGDGPEERAWAEALAARPEHRVTAAWPGFPDHFPDIPRPADLEAALAVAGVEAAVVGGPLDLRDEALRRTAASGFAAICLHPPGENADPYYQVALSREETGAVVVPDLRGRLHPGVEAIRKIQAEGDLGAFRGLRIEVPAREKDGDLRAEFARWADLARLFIGEVESLTALGDPPGEAPTRALTVQLRGPGGKPAEVRISSPGPGAPARITLEAERGAVVLEVAPDWSGPSRLTRPLAGGAASEDLPPWDGHRAVLDALGRSVAGRATHPDLIDGTRAMELASAVARSLRRGRSVDLHYEEVSEANNFKTVMTSVGCMVLLGCLVALPAALVGPALGIGQTIYIAYAIPPLLVLFALLQLLRLAMKPPAPAGKPRGKPGGGVDPEVT
jgi:myo-inositol 2-dehydrogenase/D-chiro-inositol 1-dehydrogenase